MNIESIKSTGASSASFLQLPGDLLPGIFCTGEII
jgi:hypothetical protein